MGLMEGETMARVLARRILLGAASLIAAITPQVLSAQSFRDRLPQDEVIYFMLPDRFENGDAANDRGGLNGDKFKTGFDPASKGFYHGGDLKGLIARLDYIKGLGATAIWLGPIFKNKPVQGGPGQESAGYHGYWITDFTTVDPHLGTEADMRAFVDGAHAKGMKVYMDIITNHTADVIGYKECPNSSCTYRSRADYPYQRQASGGAAINPGFLGDQVQTAENFTKLTNPNFAYTVTVPKAEANVKVPAWLNDPIWYHNRGNSTFRGENSQMGDFVGLDDLMTENPRVVQGFIEIYGAWIDKYGVDGFRIDTARHVNPEFWAAFGPAMLARAKAKGIPNFHIFGEVATSDIDVALLAKHTRVDKLPTVLDFAFARAVYDTVAGSAGTDTFIKLFDNDVLYEDGVATAQQLPTFLGNHDAGRFATFVRQANPKASDDEVLKRVILGHAMLFTLRGVPTIYSGDEQGFVGDGGDQDAREDMFASKVAGYNDNKLIGTKATTADSNFDQKHPLYLVMARLAGLRLGNAALTRGKQVIRNYDEKPGLFAVSRIDPTSGREVLIAFNTSTAPITRNVEVSTKSVNFKSLYGACGAKAAAPGSYSVTIAPLDFIICAAGEAE
jgi:neopullulanase